MDGLNTTEFVELLRKHMTRAHLNIKDLATMLGVSGTTVVYWRHGKARPALNMIPKLVAALNLSDEDAQEFKSVCLCTYGRQGDLSLQAQPPKEPVSPKVFVSHSHRDDAFTAQLVKDLQVAGITTWVDGGNMTPGNFMQRISDALEIVEWLVLVLTPNAIASRYVRLEVDAALNRTQQGLMRGVIPVLAAPCTAGSIPIFWDVLHRFDATAGYRQALSRLLLALGVQSPTEGSQSYNLLDLSVDDLMKMGNALLAASMDIQALPYFEHVTQREPSNEFAWGNYAGTLEAAERYDEALAAYDQVLALNSKNTGAWIMKARLLLDLHRYVEAIQACDRACASDPNYPIYWDAWLCKAEALRALGRDAEAEAVIQQIPNPRARKHV